MIIILVRFRITIHNLHWKHNHSALWPYAAGQIHGQQEEGRHITINVPLFKKLRPPQNVLCPNLNTGRFHLLCTWGAVYGCLEIHLHFIKVVCFYIISLYSVQWARRPMGARGWAADEGPLSSWPMGRRGWAEGEGPLSSWPLSPHLTPHPLTWPLPHEFHICIYAGTTRGIHKTRGSWGGGGGEMI